MIKIQTNWDLRKIPWTKYFIISKIYIFKYYEYWNLKYSFELYKGFISDFWSIPLFLSIVFDKTWYVSYLLHDFLYSLKWYWTKYNENW